MIILPGYASSTSGAEPFRSIQARQEIKAPHHPNDRIESSNLSHPLRRPEPHLSLDAVLTVCAPKDRQTVKNVDELLTTDVSTCCFERYIKGIQTYKQARTGIFDLT